VQRETRLEQKNCRRRFVKWCECNEHPLDKKLRLGVTDGLERTQKCQSALARWLVGWIFALTHHGLFDYYQNSDCVQRQTKTKAGERKHYYTWSIVGRKAPYTCDRVYRFSTSAVEEAAFSPPFHWPFHNHFPSFRTAPSRLWLYGGLLSAEDKHLLYHVINILFIN